MKNIQIINRVFTYFNRNTLVTLLQKYILHIIQKHTYKIHIIHKIHIIQKNILIRLIGNLYLKKTNLKISDVECNPSGIKFIIRIAQYIVMQTQVIVRFLQKLLKIIPIKDLYFTIQQNVFIYQFVSNETLHIE